MSITKAAVVGGGRMGGGIAQSLIAAGIPVLLVDAGAEAVAQARARVLASYDRAVRRGFISPAAPDSAAEVRELLGSAERITDLPVDLDLVIEAVPEDPELKVRVLGDIAAAVGEDTVIASNTSSISVNDLATAVRRPERFLGMHFFNPVPASRLVEVVRGSLTEDRVVGAAEAVAGQLGKESIVVADAPGFASSRLGVALGLEAIRMLEDGVADAESIDRAMTLGYAHTTGPLRSTDLVGLDVRLAIARYLESRLGERFRPPRLLVDKVARGETGRKSGRGFYDWNGEQT